MTPRDRQTFMLWSRTEEHRRRVEESRKLVAACPDGSAVLFSGGKDSLVVLDLALQAGKCAQIVYWDYGWELMPEPYQEEVEKQMAIMRNRHKQTCCRIVILDNDHREIPDPIPFVIGSFRADENGRRRRGGPDAPAFGAPCRHVIFHWSWLDVWAYIAAEDLPYHSSYDARAAVEGWEKARFSTLFDPELKDLTLSVDALTAWGHRGKGSGGSRKASGSDKGVSGLARAVDTARKKEGKGVTP
jgi:3'-phosphoadenosine 5'-phosphosulfate sulfotransferase (PAPS reductase)/FAD synthetase